MDKYSIVFTEMALQALDTIYAYIAQSLQEPEVALRLVAQIEESVASLERMPYRCVERRRGTYANRGYRQLFVENFTIVYRIEESTKQVVIVTTKYSHSQF